MSEKTGQHISFRQHVTFLARRGIEESKRDKNSIYFVKYANRFYYWTEDEPEEFES